MYQNSIQKSSKTFPVLFALAVLAASNVASAGTSPVFTFPNFITAAGSLQATGSAAFAGAAIALTSGATGPHEAGAVWYPAAQNTQAFTTDFTWQPNPAIGFGMTFCVQGNNDTVYADTNMLGYGAYAPSLGGQNPILKSVAVKFDLEGGGQNNFPVGGAPNSTGLYINGGPEAALIPEIDLNPSGINLHTGDIMAAHLVYDGSLLTMTLRDTVTGAQFRTSWPINIPAITGNSAWVGFTSGTVNPVAQNLLSWSFSQGYATRLATPTFSVAAGSYPSAQSVLISAPSGGTIYYTTNGQQPTTASNVYSGPISVSSSEVVQAVAIQAGSTDSLVAVANYQIAPASSPTINFPSGFAGASGLISTIGRATFSGSALQLTDTNTGEEAGAAWYVVPVNVQSFTTNFTIQLLNANAQGMTFTIQNQPPASSDTSILYVSGGPYAIGNASNGMGYSGSTGGVGGQIAGLLNSVAIKFDLYDGSGNTTGLYTNGADLTIGGNDMTSSGVSLHSGNPLNVTLAYNGTSLAMTITDTKTKASYSTSWAINIPAIVGGSTAYVGFTGGTGGLFATQDVLSWTYATAAQAAVAVPAAPTNLHVQ
jgi:hypothetical protein